MLNYEPFALSPFGQGQRHQLKMFGKHVSCDRTDAADEMGVRVAVEWGPGPQCGQKLRLSPASAFTLLEEALQHRWGHTASSILPLTPPLFPLRKIWCHLPLRQWLSISTVHWNHLGGLDKLLVPRPDSGPMNLNSLGKRSGNSNLKSPWWIANGQPRLRGIHCTVYSFTYTRR